MAKRQLRLLTNIGVTIALGCSGKNTAMRSDDSGGSGASGDSQTETAESGNPDLVEVPAIVAGSFLTETVTATSDGKARVDSDVYRVRRGVRERVLPIIAKSIREVRWKLVSLDGVPYTEASLLLLGDAKIDESVARGKSWIVPRRSVVGAGQTGDLPVAKVSLELVLADGRTVFVKSAPANASPTPTPESGASRSGGDSHVFFVTTGDYPSLQNLINSQDVYAAVPIARCPKALSKFDAAGSQQNSEKAVFAALICQCEAEYSGLADPLRFEAFANFGVNTDSTASAVRGFMQKYSKPVVNVKRERMADAGQLIFITNENYMIDSRAHLALTSSGEVPSREMSVLTGLNPTSTTASAERSPNCQAWSTNSEIETQFYFGKPARSGRNFMSDGTLNCSDNSRFHFYCIGL